MFGYIFHLRSPLVLGGQRHEKTRKGGGELGPDEDDEDEWNAISDCMMGVVANKEFKEKGNGNRVYL